jgi:fructose-1,6-bisphosphatase
VITANDDLVRVWQTAQPVDGSLNLTDGAIIGEIASMYQKVTIWDIGPFKSVCI